MARLVPAFLATVVLTWVAVRYLAPADWYIPGKRDLVGNLLLLGNWRPQEFPFLDGSCWMLPLQLMAFTVAALMWRSRCGRGRGLRVALWVAVLLYSLPQSVCMITPGTRPPRTAIAIAIASAP